MTSLGHIVVILSEAKNAFGAFRQEEDQNFEVRITPKSM